MAAELRLFFDRRVIDSIADDVAAVDPHFARDVFVTRAVHGLAPLSLTERGAHIAEALYSALDRPFDEAADVLVRSLGRTHASPDAFGMEPFRYMPHVVIVARHGLDRFETSMRALYELTKRFTSEFGIRPFLVRHPEATYARLVAWTADRDVHVRRLVSEGTRPRLPWAPRLPAFVADPAPVIALLDRLVDDPELYVRRSVANNLNDIAKDHPEQAIEVAERWWRHGDEPRRWVVRHGLRSLVKAAAPGALQLFGAGAEPEVHVALMTPAHPVVHIGESHVFRVALTSRAKVPQELIVDFAVHFVKANGMSRPKVFKLRRLSLAPGATLELTGRVSFARLSTRTPYAGPHAFELRVNGRAQPLGVVEVRPEA